MSRPSSPIQPADPAARPRWEHSPASASVSLSAGPSPSKATKRTEPVDTIDLTKTKQEEQEDTDERIEKMDQGDVEHEERSQRTEKRIEEMEMEKVDHVTAEDGPTTKDSGTKLTPPSPPREKSISKETDGQVNITKLEQVHDEETKTQHRHNHDSEASLMTNGPTGASTGNPSLDVTGSSATPTTAATASNTAANSTTTTAGNNLLPAVLHRPPIRPAVTGVSKSKFDLELNPFEQSFSRSSTSIHPHNGNTQNTGSSSEDIRIAYGAWDSKRGRAEAAAGVVAAGGDKRKRSEEEDDDRNNHLHPKMSLSGSSSPNDKTVLPPLSALTSPVPVDPASHFSWAGISSFLRTGPLSPAMLNGPTSTSGNNTHHGHNHSVGGHSVTGLTPGGGFDPSTFRTGFTPGGILAGGVGGAGFTPGYAGLLTGGGGFPMPSPNTAAFLSMVTHGTPGPGTPTGVGRLGTIGAVGQDMQNGGGKMMLSRPTTAGAAGMNGVGTADDVHASGGGMNGDTRRSSGDDSGASASIHTMHQGGQQQQQQQQVAMTPNSLNVLTGVVSRMNSANADEDGMYSASTAGNRQQNSLAHQQSHIGPNDADLAQRLPPPPPHPDHPMHNATDYFVNPTGVQSGGMAGQNGAGVPPHMHAPHSGYVGSHLSHQHPQHLHQQPQQQQLQQQPMSLPPAHLHASSADPRVGVPGGGYPMHHAGGATMANVNPQGAGVGPGGPLNGLFLLSQAHQELGKREEAQRVAGVAPVGDAVIGGADTSRRAVSGSTATGGRKRKSVDAEKPAAGGRGGGSKRSKKNGSIGTQHDQPQQGNGINLPAYQGQTILQQSQALLAQGLQAQAERDAMQEPDDDEDQKMMDMNGGKDGGDGGDGMGKKDGKPETEEEKRKNFLERNRQAALKCRQRKKAWLTQLQTKVDGLTEENERLKAMLTSITDEAQKLSAVLSSHRDCPGMASSMAQLGLVLPPPLPGHMVQQQRQMSVVPTFVPPQPH